MFLSLVVLHNCFYDDDLEFRCPPGDDRSRHTDIETSWHDVGFLCVSHRATVVQIPSYAQTRFGPIRLEVGAQSVGRGKRVPCGGSHAME